jgi:hypothetical protein
MYSRGPMVHRLAHGSFKAERGVQLPLGPPFSDLQSVKI